MFWEIYVMCQICKYFRVRLFQETSDWRLYLWGTKFDVLLMQVFSWQHHFKRYLMEIACVLHSSLWFNTQSNICVIEQYFSKFLKKTNFQQRFQKALTIYVNIWSLRKCHCWPSPIGEQCLNTTLIGHNFPDLLVFALVSLTFWVLGSIIFGPWFFLNGACREVKGLMCFIWLVGECDE